MPCHVKTQVEVRRRWYSAASTQSPGGIRGPLLDRSLYVAGLQGHWPELARSFRDEKKVYNNKSRIVFSDFPGASSDGQAAAAIGNMSGK